MPSRAESTESLIKYLELFNKLPDCAGVPVKVACALTSRSKSSIYRDISKNRIKATVFGNSRLINVGSLRKLFSDNSNQSEPI